MNEVTRARMQLFAVLLIIIIAAHVIKVVVYEVGVNLHYKSEQQTQ